MIKKIYQKIKNKVVDKYNYFQFIRCLNKTYKLQDDYDDFYGFLAELFKDDWD